MSNLVPWPNTNAAPASVSVGVNLGSVEEAEDSLNKIEVAAQLCLAVLAKATSHNHDEVLDAVRDVLKALAAI